MREDLLEELQRIVRTYVPEAELSDLLPYVKANSVKYVLVELERRKSRPISVLDGEVIKDLFFHFC